MTDWMMETLLWTAVLIAFVLLIRRPVSRALGPQMAYALWALPALRLVLPPLELPAWMRLIPEEAPAKVAAVPEEMIVTAFDLPVARSQSDVAAHPDQSLGAASDVPTPLTHAPTVDASMFDYELLLQVGVAVWLIGAAIFLGLRFSAYFRLRDELLEEGREVGREGKVRFVETPGTKSPLAFGVIDKVVALPEGFLAHPDRQSRDLALEHELQHHKGGDLLANVLVQPLFAIHWWNPLGRYGWLALRRDQEAACDARVMASAQREEREAYANLIVSFATAPNAAPHHALTAPMACPVLGDKSIVHRLRSLKMENTNTKQRVAGRLMLGAAVIALPLTASISYAATEAPEAPEPPLTPLAVQVAPEAPDAPEAPEAPEAPAAPLVDEQIIVVDPDGEVSGVEGNGKNVFVWKSEDGEGDPRVVFRTIERTFDSSDFPNVRRFKKEDLEKLMEGSKDSQIVLRSRGDSIRFFDRSELDASGKLTDEQIDEILKEVREGLEEANEALENLPQIIEEAQAEVEVERLKSGERRVRVEQSCKGGDEEIVTEFKDEDGVKVIHICQKRVMVEALNGLREARRSIKESDMEQGTRSRALREIDRVISRWESEAR